MYNRLLDNLEDDLNTFDKQDKRQIRKIIKYIKKNKEIPLYIIKYKSYISYQDYCLENGLEILTEWQYDLCKTELSWK